MRAFSCSAVFFLGAALMAQTPAAQKPVDTQAAARAVQLSVTVRDKHGAPVKDLKAADLTLTEDGRPQTISSLTHGNALPPAWPARRHRLRDEPRAGERTQGHHKVR